MSMSMGGGGVKAEPNVTPMIDVMLVLLIIFMIIVPAIQAGFTAIPPQGANIKPHPEDEQVDQVLGIDSKGQYFLNKHPIPNEKLGEMLKEIFDARTVDKILYVKAHKELPYGKIADALDVASKSGVRVSGMITDQLPGTVSSVVGDNLSDQFRQGGKAP